MKKTYLKPNALVVEVETQHVMTLSTTDTPAEKTGTVYGRQGRFSDWDEDEE